MINNGPNRANDKRYDELNSSTSLAIENEQGQIHQSVAKWVWLHHLLVASTLTLYGIHVYWLADFYTRVNVAGDLAPVFRWSMVSVVVFVFIVSNILARTHGSSFSGVDNPALIMTFSCLLILTAVPHTWIPISCMVVFFCYVLIRKDNRKRLIVFVTIITMGTLALVLSSFFTNIVYRGFFGGILTGAGTAYIIRLIRTFQSGGVFKIGLQTEWQNYGQVKDSLNTFDVILESESRSPASRVTALWSRSAWTHSAMIVRNPPDEIKHLYGIPTGEMLTREKEDLQGLLEKSSGADEKAVVWRSRLDMLNTLDTEELFVFEAIRPVVALTPLRWWMEEKERVYPYKVIVVSRLKMYQGRAQVTLHMDGLTQMMRTMHGVQFVDDPKFMIRANYQLNRDKDIESVFCSELIALTYQEVGLLSTAREASNYTPNDFWPETKTPLLVDAKLVDGFRLRAAVQPSAPPA